VFPAEQNPGAELINKKLNDYWARIADKYYVPDVFGRRIIQVYMTKLKPLSLIEVGCGSGELFSCFKEIPIVLGVDWQEAMLKRSKDRIDRHEYTNIKLQQMNITENLPLPLPGMPCKFDLALTRTVLMHIQPDRIVDACRNMTLLSDKILAFEYSTATQKELAFHNWNHDYVRIFYDLGFKCTEAYQRPDDVDQVLFIFERSKDVKRTEDSQLAKSSLLEAA
jgi:2-polyprenyl-3-methyl-5-hydroxy-6-metoxy-1,4-benzoquinol methylase